jgi:hypothetical protein
MRCAVRLRAYSLSTLCRPAAPMRRATSGCSRSDEMADAIAGTSLPDTVRPVIPSRTVSGAAPERPATTGSPALAASVYTVYVYRRRTLYTEACQSGPAGYGENLSRRKVLGQLCARNLTYDQDTI